MWFVLMLSVGAGLLARHAVALPAPARDAALTASVEGLRTPAERGKWLAVHVLYAECRCSQRITDHLVGATRPPDWAEIVLWVGSPPPPPALEQRFDVRRISSAELARAGVESAPMLIAAGPEGRLRYAGGYTQRKQGPSIEDLRILEAARAPGPLEALPIFGCAVSEKLRAELGSFFTR